MAHASFFCLVELDKIQELIDRAYVRTFEGRGKCNKMVQFLFHATKFILHNKFVVFNLWWKIDQFLFYAWKELNNAAELRYARWI
jgi:hypothetical protein